MRIREGDLLRRNPFVEQRDDVDGDNRMFLVLDEPRPVRDLLPSNANDWKGVWVLSSNGSVVLKTLRYLIAAYEKV